MIVSVALSYFRRKIGPQVFYSYPLELDVLGKRLSKQIANLMDQNIPYGFNTHSFKLLRAMNYYFEIHSDWARGNKEMLMVSVVLDSSDPSKYKTSEIIDKISALLVKFTEKFKSDEHIFTAFYIEDLKYLEYREDLFKLRSERLSIRRKAKMFGQKKKIIEKNALLKTWVHDLYSAIIESTEEKIDEENPPQISQKDISQKIELLEINIKEIKNLIVEDFSKQINLRERELEIKDRELKLKEQQLAEISTVGDLPNMEKDVLVFVSYATKDAELFKIKEIAEILTSYEKIEDVLYWQEDMADNIIKYMSDNLANCDVMLLFCSPNALKSIPIEKEWTSADIMNKPIIPVFVKPDHIPPLLKSRLGVEFDTFDLQKTINEIYSLILKKIEKRIIDIKDLKTDF